MDKKIIYITLGLFLAALPLIAHDSISAKITHIEGVAKINSNLAKINDAIFEGDKLSTEKGRAEVEIDGNYIRLNNFSQIIFASLEDESITLEISFGEVYVQTEKKINIQTPQEAFSVEGIYRIEVDRYGTKKFPNPDVVDDFDRWEKRREGEIARGSKTYYERRPFYVYYPVVPIWPSTFFLGWSIGWFPDFYWWPYYHWYWYPDYHWYPGVYWGFYQYWGWYGFYWGWFPRPWLWWSYPRWFYFSYFRYRYGYFPYYRYHYWRPYYYADWSYSYRPKPFLSTIHKAQLQRPAYFGLGERETFSLKALSAGKVSLNQALQPSRLNQPNLTSSSLSKVSSSKIYPSRLAGERSTRIFRNSFPQGKTSSDILRRTTGPLKETMIRPSRISSPRSLSSKTRSISRSSLISSGITITRPSRSSLSSLSSSSKLSVSPRFSTFSRLSIAPRSISPSWISSSPRLPSSSRIAAPMRSLPSPSFSRPFNNSFSRFSFGSFSSSFSHSAISSRPASGSIRRR